VEPSLHYRHRISEASDLAADFIENEIGRHDWMENWPKWKSKHPDYRERIRAWLERIGENLDPDEIVQAIDQMKILAPGKWR
jgi:hypothetical protein